MNRLNHRIHAAVIAAIGATAALAMVSFAPVAFAGHHSELAQVISTTPIYQRIATPNRQCWTEQVAAVEERRVRLPQQVEYRDNRDYRDYRDYRDSGGSGAGTVLGAIIGGVVGHQFGHSTGGRDRGTAAGALIGGLIGNHASRNSYGNDDGGYRRVSRDSVAI